MEVIRRVLLADTGEELRRSLASSLSNEPDMQVIGQTGDAVELLRMAREMKPDGSYSKVKAEPGAPRVDSQMALYDLFRDSFVLPVAQTVQAPAPKTGLLQKIANLLHGKK